MVWDGEKIPIPTELRAKKLASEWSWLATASRDPNPITIVQFCAIGLLVAIIAILSFPDFGTIIAQYNQF
jgi:hypothetical protein